MMHLGFRVQSAQGLGFGKLRVWLKKLEEYGFLYFWVLGFRGLASRV